MSNKVTVNIFGQEYTISGDESPEKIVQIASWVDQRMREIDEMVGSKLPTTSLAVLSAINVAKEYFELIKDAKDSLKLAEQRLEDAQRYMNLWDETKKSFQEFQETVGDLKEDKVNLETKLELKEKEIKKILQGQGSMRQEIERGTEQKIKEARDKYRELENNFFDLQMENIKIKSELEKLRGENK